MIGQVGLIGQIGFLFVIGLVVGSFLNVLIWRLNDEKAPKFWQGRSICPKCKHQLAWFDNIPLLSFMALWGKCRFCRKPISWQYPVVELTTAVATVLLWLLSPELGQFGKLVQLGIVYSFIVIFFADWIYGLIPDEMEITIVAAAVLLWLSQIRQIRQISLIGLIWQNFIVGLISALAFFLVVLATKFRGMGLGDVKLAFVVGFLLGWPNALVAFWVSFILGGIFAVVLLLLRRKNFRETIALGPFLVLGTGIAALWSDRILQIVGL